MNFFDIADAFDSRRPQLNRLFQFLDEHQNYKIDIDHRFNASLFAEDCCAREKIRKTFISAMYATGGANLSRSGEGCRYMFHQLNRLPDTPTLDFPTFLRLFDAENYRELHWSIADDNRIVNFRRT